MSKLVPLITLEEMYSDKLTEEKVWHAADVTGTKAVCGAEGIWHGAGLWVTCKECLKKPEGRQVNWPLKLSLV